MKKIIASVLLVVLVCTASLASAATRFSYTGSETTDFIRWSASDESTGSNWHLTWENCDLSSTKRAVVRVYAAPGVYASSLYVYSSASTAYHPYKSGYGQGKANTYLAGRMDNRDTGTISVLGWFHN